MKIITQTGYVFDLPEDFDAGFSRYNSILSDTGDQTLPMTLPATDETKKYFSYSHRIDNWFKPVIDHEVIVSDGVISKRATLSLNSLDFSEGIACTIYFGNGDFYSRIDKKKLSSLNWDTVKHPDYDNVTLDERRQYLIDLCVECLKDPEYSDRYGVVPAASSTNYTIKANVSNLLESSEYTSNSLEYKSEEVSGLFILNGPERFKQTDGNVTPRFSNFEGSTTQIFIEDSKGIVIGIGYGITPFLKIGYIVDTIFSTYGYTVDMSDYIDYWVDKMNLDQFFWRKILLANTVADAIYGGKLEEKQLVPNVYIADFITELNKLLAGKFVIDEVNKKAVFKRYDTVIEQTPSDSIDEYVSGDCKMELPDFKTILFSDGTDTGEQDNEDNVEILTFNLVNRKQIKMNVNESTYDWVYGGYLIKKLDRTFYMCDLSMPIVHKNSAISVGGVIKTEDDNEFTDIRFIYHTLDSIYYKAKQAPSVYFFALGQQNNQYRKYCVFRKNSNIPGTVDLSLPRSVFYSKDLSVPVMYKNQPILIQHLEGSLTADPVNVKCSFVTLRSYI